MSDAIVRANVTDLTAASHRVVEGARVSTTDALPGYRIERSLGVVRGVVVRSRSLVGNVIALLQVLIGGDITMLTSLSERARRDAFELMLKHAAELGANAVVGMRFDANDVAMGVTEVLAYGTAVVATKVED